MAGHLHSSRENDAENSEVVAATFKVLVLGNSSVGKSSLIKRHSSSENPGSMMPTIGMDFTDIIVTVRGTKIKLRVWDTAGQERFFTFTKQFFRGTQAVLLVYDVTNMESFQTLRKWNQTIEEYGLHDVSMIIIGNKCDLEEKRVIPKELGEQLAFKRSNTFLETSAVTGHNVKKAFYTLAEALIHSYGIFQPGQEAEYAEESHFMDATKRESIPESGNDAVKSSNKQSRRTRKHSKCCHKA